MTYEEAVESRVSARQARVEIEHHDASWSEFQEDKGVADHYDGADVLGWMGY